MLAIIYGWRVKVEPMKDVRREKEGYGHPVDHLPKVIVELCDETGWSLVSFKVVIGMCRTFNVSFRDILIPNIDSVRLIRPSSSRSHL